ncbi:PfkB family carbohydrate kinase [Streptomyces sp.]|uniref:carbohydrate kinase family protein n=1 Tax=unclassified Streptomyces TaxID=2593676 RepID=UPI002D76A597|nr:PfkB family carbohydrate kinase [Streptomyces sp.]WSY70400.1 PfkB family carbohydrate kinase [Streptomyces sp. NBC_00885]HET6355601.1 PfkB family carbohydrate kinase [Streptomyces sp.]
MTVPGAAGADALLVIGDVVTDVVARHRTPLAKGTDTAAAIRILPGGAGANVACWAARWGCRDVRLLARVGQEEAGWHDARLRAAGVGPLLVPDAEAPTATVIALVDESAERTFLTDSGAVLRLSPADWSPSLLGGVGHLHLSGYLLFADTSRRLALLALESARALGIPVSVDPASAGFISVLGVDRMLAALSGADILVPNADEARLLTGLPDPADAAAKLSRHVPLTVVTLGAGGALIAESGTVTAHVPSVPAEAVDSTGAGDAFTGAFLAARLAGADAATAAAEGCRAGADAVTLTGGRPDQRRPPHAG